MTTTMKALERTSPNGKPAAEEPAPLSVYAIRFRQKRPDVSLYVTTLRLKDLLGRFQSDTCGDDEDGGYQRPVTPSRLRQLSTYLRREEGMLPTSILLCIRQPHRAEFKASVGANGKGETGTLTIEPEVPLWVVDGQHRLYGLERALKKDKAKWLADYPLPVVIVEGIDAYEEMRYFHVINTRHKGVPTDVVDRHLLALEPLDLLDVEAAAGHDLHVLEPFPVEGAAYQGAELRVDTARVKVAHQLLDADVDHRFRGVEADSPEPVTQGSRQRQRRPNAIVVPVDEDNEVHAGIHELCILLGGQDGVAVVRGDQRMGDGAGALAAPPGRLGIG